MNTLHAPSSRHGYPQSKPYELQQIRRCRRYRSVSQLHCASGACPSVRCAEPTSGTVLVVAHRFAYFGCARAESARSSGVARAACALDLAGDVALTGRVAQCPVARCAADAHSSSGASCSACASDRGTHFAGSDPAGVFAGTALSSDATAAARADSGHQRHPSCPSPVSVALAGRYPQDRGFEHGAVTTGLAARAHHATDQLPVGTAAVINELGLFLQMARTLSLIISVESA